MAIDTWLRGVIDPNAATILDGASHIHLWTRATSDGGDITIAFDRSKVKSKAALSSALNQAIKIFAGGNELTG